MSDLSYKQPDQRILKFIRRHHVMTLASSAGLSDVDSGGETGGMWCCNLFYAYIPPTKDVASDGGGRLVFTSLSTTVHAVNFIANPQVAGSIVLESKVIGRLQGLQLQGVVHRAEALKSESYAEAKRAYLKRFPFAAGMLSDLWVLELTRLKYTDNTLGFGTKLLWP